MCYPEPSGVAGLVWNQDFSPKRYLKKVNLKEKIKSNCFLHQNYPRVAKAVQEGQYWKTLNYRTPW